MSQDPTLTVEELKVIMASSAYEGVNPSPPACGGESAVLMMIYSPAACKIHCACI